MRLTPSGWGTLGAGVGLYATGVVLGLPELTVAGAALLLLLVAAVGWVLRPPSLSVSRQLEPVRVRRGSPALGLVSIANTGHRRAPRLTVEDRAGDRVVTLDLPPLHPGEDFTSTYRLPTDRRGRVRRRAAGAGSDRPVRPAGPAATVRGGGPPVGPSAKPPGPGGQVRLDHRDGRPDGRHRS